MTLDNGCNNYPTTTTVARSFYIYHNKFLSVSEYRGSSRVEHVRSSSRRGLFRFHKTVINAPLPFQIDNFFLSLYYYLNLILIRVTAAADEKGTRLFACKVFFFFYVGERIFGQEQRAVGARPVGRNPLGPMISFSHSHICEIRAESSDLSVSYPPPFPPCFFFPFEDLYSL